MAGRFEVFQDASGRYRFHFAADSGQKIPSPESYTTEDEARQRLQSLRANVSPANANPANANPRQPSR